MHVTTAHSWATQSGETHTVGTVDGSAASLGLTNLGPIGWGRTLAPHEAAPVTTRVDCPYCNEHQTCDCPYRNGTSKTLGPLVDVTG